MYNAIIAKCNGFEYIYFTMLKAKAGAYATSWTRQRMGETS